MSLVLMRVVWRMALLCGASYLAWQVVSINLSDHYARLPTEGNKNNPELALKWDPSNPRALAKLGAISLEEGNKEEAVNLLAAAILANPANAKPLLLLTDIRRQAGQLAVADRMVETAHRLMPVDPQVQLLIAAHWYERDRLDRMVPHLSTVLLADQQYREEVFPVLLQIAENPDTRRSLEPLTNSPPVWWDHFASYAARNASNMDVIRAIVSMRKQPQSAPISERERSVYISRLKKEGFFAEAYLHWVSGLNSEQRNSLAFLYNGDFELELSDSSFGWQTWLPTNSGYIISTATTYGVGGEQALFMSSRGKQSKFRLGQSLYLSPGKYRFSGRARPLKLNARKGLYWQVHCIGSGKPLGKSEVFLGTSDWREFEFNIFVSPECEGQQLRLLLAGNRDVDQVFTGEIWFDDLRIQQVRPSEN